MKKTPAIAHERHQEASAKFTHKLDALEQLIANNNFSQFPKRASIASFAAWKDDALGVEPLSRSVIYDRSDDYMAMRQRMGRLLILVQKARAKSSRKENIEVELRRKFALEEERAKSYVNQYSIAMAELSEARKEIERLNNKIRRQIIADSRITPLRDAKNTLGKIE